MSKNVRRYCSNCDCGTLQYSEKRYLNVKTGVDRIFLSIISAGIFEACLEKYWICTECGKESKK